MDEKRKKMGRYTAIFLCAVLLSQALVGCTSPGTGTVGLTPLPSATLPRVATKAAEKPAAPNFLSTSGSKIVDSTGKEVTLTGINWFGMETGTFAPHGIWARKWTEMMDQIVALGFNTIRLPYSNEALNPKAVPTEGIDYDYNPDLEGLNGLQIMDKIIEGARDRGLKVILDRHRIIKEGQSKLWYNDKYSEQQWIDDWVMLAERYKGNDTVIGADLHNEPAGDAAWGTGDPKTDWRLAAERAGNAIHEANPDWLIIVEGVEKFERDWYWMGGNLSRAREYPVRLKIPNKLVYSAHDYGPGVFMQGWFQDKSFPENLPQIWDEHWGYLAKEGIAPVLLGEFGGRSVGDDIEGKWQRKLIDYLKENGISYTYWSFNPNSSDTGGLLKDDWFGIDKAKRALLGSYQFPLLAKPKVNVSPAAAEPAPYTMPVGPSGLKVAFKPALPVERGSDVVMEFKIFNTGYATYNLKDLELRYWFKADRPDESHLFSVDYANIEKSKIVGEFVEEQQGDQTNYLKVTFKDGTLQNNGASIEMKLRFKEADGSQHQLLGDWSFMPFKMMKDWDRVTLHINGERVWGKEPG
ncbi:MAG: cellulase family glycosylhydrolase [Chloroflexi bacterium]|nr:cellulase family glycosylhydrolase [Chloroflexota bacterium]